MKHSGLQRARQSTRKKMKKSLGPDFVDPSNLGLHGKETSSDIRCDICHDGLPINSKKDCINCKKCAIRAHANCVRTQLNVKYIKSLWLCVNCRHCYECDKSGVEQNELVFCRSCDRSYHWDCIESKGVTNIVASKYLCHRCVKPPVINTRLTTPRQNSTTATTATSTTSATSSSNSTTTTSATATSNGNRVIVRSVNKSHPPENKSSNTISSHPSTSSSASTPTPSTSRASYHVKKEMMMEKQRPRSHSNTPTDRQVRSDNPERSQPQSRSERLVRPERPVSIDSLTQRRQERPTNLKDSTESRRVGRPFAGLPLRSDDRSVVINPVAQKHNEIVRSSNRQVDDDSNEKGIASGLELRFKHAERLLRFMSGKKNNERSMKVSQIVNESRTNIDLPDIDMKDSFTDKPLTKDNEKLLEKPRLIKKVEPDNNSDKSKDLKDDEKQSLVENRRLESESTENSRNPMNINKTNGPGNRGTSLLSLHSPLGNENASIPQRLNLPEKRKANEIQGSGFVLSKPTELTQETAKLLKDSNGAKKLKLVLFERACKAESLLPAETSIWTTEDVFNFIRFIGFPDAADNFLDHQIDGKSLLLLSRRDVLTGFKLKLGPALKIYAHIFRLQRKRPALLLED